MVCVGTCPSTCMFHSHESSLFVGTVYICKDNCEIITLWRSVIVLLEPTDLYLGLRPLHVIWTLSKTTYLQTSVCHIGPTYSIKSILCVTWKHGGAFSHVRSICRFYAFQIDLGKYLEALILLSLILLLCLAMPFPIASICQSLLLPDNRWNNEV